MFIVVALWQAEICYEDGRDFQDSLGYRKRIYPEKQNPIKMKAVSENAVQVHFQLTPCISSLSDLE